MQATVQFDSTNRRQIERGDATITVLTPGKRRLFGLLAARPDRVDVYRGDCTVFHNVATGDRPNTAMERWLGARLWKARHDALEQLDLKERGDAAREVPQNTPLALESRGN